MDNIIEVRNVTFHYPALEGEEPARVVENMDLSIRRGSFVSILGHNASGKSTLARLFNGLLKPVEGQVLVNGMDTADNKKEIEIRRTVGMVFQNPDNQLVASVVEEDVAFGPENLGVPPAEIRKRVDKSLQEVGMLDYKNRPPHKLSGGQKQRVAIAGIIAMEPQCIVLDEPTAMLDPRGRKEVMSTITRLNRELGITIVLITHYMDEAALCDRVVVLNEGEVVLDDEPRQAFKEIPVLKRCGLDVPQPAELIYMLRREGVDLPNDILTVGECAEALSGTLQLEE